MENIELSAINYKTLLARCDSFVSFDISVNSTGWARYYDGKLEYGTYKIESKDDLHRRFEFRAFAKSIIGDREYSFVSIEDIIGGINFDTTKILTQLNTIIDDMMYLGEIKTSKIRRIDNKKWKKYLRFASNSEYNIRASKDKEEIVYIMKNIGFDEDVKQDVYDAIGMALGVIVSDTLGEETATKRTRVKTDLTKGYNIINLTDGNRDEFLAKHSKKLPIFKLTYDKSYKDIILMFKKLTTDIGDDFCFHIKAPTNKVGVLALLRLVEIYNGDCCEFIAIKKGAK